jgi:hypothetical protein
MLDVGDGMHIVLFCSLFYYLKDFMFLRFFGLSSPKSNSTIFVKIAILN